VVAFGITLTGISRLRKGARTTCRQTID
jgi:hypothetical protein